MRKRLGSASAANVSSMWPNMPRTAYACQGILQESYDPAHRFTRVSAESCLEKLALPGTPIAPSPHVDATPRESGR